MRKEFLQQENENTRKYLTRAARIYDSIMNGTPLEDGTVLRDIMDDVEQTEFKNYLMTIMNPIIVRVVECEGRVCTVFRRNLPAYFGRCGFGYFAADRKPFVDETL